jgi:hypothetical protein
MSRPDINSGERAIVEFYNWFPYHALTTDVQVIVLDVVRRFIPMEHIDLSAGKVMLPNAKKVNIPKAAYYFVDSL